MKSKSRNQSICPSCNKEFNIDKNRSYKIKDSIIPGTWFYNAMNQFENFSQVTCPFCGTEYKAEEARLFGIFKSPYSVMASALLLFAFLVGIPILLGNFLKK